MELRQLRYFIKVAETLNFSEAARLLCVTQSTLSQQVKQLENELGAQLLSRTSHSVALTEAGTELLPYAIRAVQAAELCSDRMADLNRMETGTLNIGVTYSFSAILTESLVDFMHRYPGIKLNIFYKPMAELMDMLRSRAVDFVLAFRPVEPIEEIESHILFQNSLCAIVESSHALASRESVSLRELEQYELALPSRGLQARNYFEHILTPYNKFKTRVELNEVDILLKLIRSTRLVTVLAEATIHNERGIKAIPLDVANNEMDGCVHTLRGQYRKRSMQEFIRILSESLAVRDRRKSWL